MMLDILSSREQHFMGSALLSSAIIEKLSVNISFSVILEAAICNLCSHLFFDSGMSL